MTAWALGDALRFGERVYGETYAQAALATQRSEQTLQNYAWVAGSVPPSRRRSGLSFSHHELVARLSPKQQIAWLDRAAREQLTVAELRELVRSRKQISGRPEISAASGDCDAVLDEVVAKAREQLLVCGYGTDVVVELVVRAPGIEYRLTGSSP